MRKVTKFTIKSLLLVVLSFCVLNIIASYAAEPIFKISSISVKEKSSGVTVNDVDLGTDSITNDIIFTDVNDYITYDLKIKNTSSDDYTIKSITDNNTSEYLKYSYDDISGTVLSAGNEKELTLTITYIKQATDPNLSTGETNLIITYETVSGEEGSEEVTPSVDPDNGGSPKTNDSIVIYFVLGGISLAALIILSVKCKKHNKTLIITLLLLIPVCAYANTLKLTVKFNNTIKVVSYDVEINLGNGSSIIYNTLAKGAKLTIPETPSKRGYTFDNWYSNNTVYDFDSVITGPISLEARYNKDTYYLTYDLDGGSLPDGKSNPSTYDIDSDITLYNPSKTGHTFTGWQLEGTTDVVNPVTITNEVGHKSYKAIYTPINYTVTFDPNNGESTFTQSIPYGSFAQVPTTPNYNGYTFAYWKLNGSQFTFDTPIENAITLVAYYTPNGDTPYVVYHRYRNLNDSGFNTYEEHLTGETGTLVNLAFRSVAGFDNPTTTKSLTISGNGDSSEEYIYERTNYLFTLNDADGDVTTATPTNSYPYETTITLTANTKTGYTFNGWRVGTDETLVSTSSTYSFPLTSATTITPVYTINNYTASFDPDNGDPITFDTKNYNQKYTRPQNNPEKTGYTFNYWELNGFEYDFESLVTDDIDLTAHYTLDTYNISYDLDGGSLADGESNPNTYTYVTSSFTLYNPSKNGYDFVGWEDLDTGVTSSTVTIYQETGAKSYKAIYTPTTYNITYNLDGGTLTTSNPTTYNINTPSFTLHNPTKDGFVFTGWTGSNGSTPELAVEIVQGSTGPKEYTANYRELDIICKKATTLNTESCNQSDAGKGCRQAGYDLTNTITYGNIIDSDVLEAGDAFDCKVKGTEYNQRFYYIRTIDDKAVLISNKNYTLANGQDNQNANFVWADAYDQLPTTTDWNALPITFNDKAARLITLDDLYTLAGTTNLSGNGSLDSYNFLFENSGYSGLYERSTQWVEQDTDGTRYRYRNDSRNLASLPVTDKKYNTSLNPVRPVIEVPLDQIEDSYVIRFNPNSGTVNQEYMNVIKGSSIGTLPTATKTDYLFDGWYTTSQYITGIDENTIPNGYETYYAKWTLAVTNAVLTNDTFILAEGATDTIVVENQADIEGYTFTSNDEDVVTVDSNGEITAIGAGSTTISMTGNRSNLVVTINITVIDTSSDFILTFDTNGAGDIPQMNVPMNTAVSNLPEPILTDNTFGGWFTDNNFVTEVKNGDIIRDNLTLYAKWVPNNAVAELNNNQFFTTLQGAIDNAPTTESTIKILADISSTNTIADVFDNNYDKNIIFDLNGHTLALTSTATSKYVFRSRAHIIIKNGTITSTATGGAIEANAGTLVLEDVRVEGKGNRQALYLKTNVGSSGNGAPVVEIRGASYLTSQAESPRGTVQIVSGTLNIKSGTIVSTSNNAIYIEGGTVNIGTKDGNAIASTPIIMGQTYGVGVSGSGKKISLFDGTIKGITDAIQNQSSVLPASNIEDNYQIKDDETEPIEGTSSFYKLLYLILINNNHLINLEANGGTVNPAAITVEQGQKISALPTPTKGIYTFGGWYYDEELTNPVDLDIAPTESTTYYAKWTYNSSNEIVSFNINSDATKEYFNNVSTWLNGATNTNYTAFDNSMKANFDNYLCSSCNATNSCSTPLAGNYCEQSIGYETGVTTGITVRISDESTKTKVGNVALYVTTTNGAIYNMIPGVTYYWESNQDSAVYGYVKATGNRRTIYSSVRNVRDLGGMEISFVRNNTTKTGTINYGRLYRGAQLTNGLTDVNSLTKLGITREIDLRPDTEQNGAVRLPKYDKSNSNTVTSSQDIIMTNYLVYPSSHMANYKALRDALKTTMEYIVNDDNENIYFHCTIGTDRTGTLAYFLEGLLGVGEEDRLEDYELSYYYGLLNRNRFHDDLQGSNITPRFYTMYNTYKTNDQIYNFYMYGLVDGESNLNNLSKDELLFFADGLGLTGYTSANTESELIVAIEAQLAIEDNLIQTFRDKMVTYN